MRNTGWILFLILLLIGVLGMTTTGAIFYVRLVYMGSLLLVTTWLWTRFSLRGLRILRQAIRRRQDRCHASPSPKPNRHQSWADSPNR